MSIIVERIIRKNYSLRKSNERRGFMHKQVKTCALAVLAIGAMAGSITSFASENSVQVYESSMENSYIKLYLQLLMHL